MWNNINNIRMATIDGDQDFNFANVNSLMNQIKSYSADLYYLVKPGVQHDDNNYFGSQEFVNDYHKCYSYVLNLSNSVISSLWRS